MMDKTPTTDSVEKIELPEDLLIAFAKYILPSVQEFYDTEAGQKYYDSFIRAHPELRVDYDYGEWNNTSDEDDDDDF